MERVAPAARRCAGPVPPFLASSLVLQMHVARFLKSESGSPNQYLGLLATRSKFSAPRHLLEETTASDGFAMCCLVKDTKVGILDGCFDL